MRPCGLMDKALVFGTKDCRFESCQGQFSCHDNIMEHGGVELSMHERPYMRKGHWMRSIAVPENFHG